VVEILRVQLDGRFCLGADAKRNDAESCYE
jgi:hypothetical protein